MSKLSRSEAAKIKGVSVSTLRRWESEGKLIPERTPSGHRRYELAQLLGIKSELSYTIGYCRGSSHDQKKDLERQKEVLELFGSELIFSLCEQFGPEVVIINRTEDSSFE